MLRLAARRASIAPGARLLSVSATLHAAPVSGGKRKMKVGFKKETREKSQKGGVTHLKFRDAVRALNYENSAGDLASLNLGALSEESLSSLDSKVVVYDAKAKQSLKELGSFKKYQHHELFKEPLSMVTENTKKLSAEFISQLDSSSRNNRVCLVGDKGIGKSTLLAQAQAIALSKYKGDVVLLHIDHAEKIVNGTSDYVFNPKAKFYHQPMNTKRWIKQLRSANKAVFQKMPLSEDISFSAKKVQYNLKKDQHSVYDFLLHNHDFGVAGPTSAFQFFMSQLKAHSLKFPVLASVDNFSGLVSQPYTAYFHPNMKPIHFTEFELGKMIQQLVSGELEFQRGGVLISESKDNGDSKTLRTGLQLEEFDPYDKISECDSAYARTMRQNGGVRPFKVEKLTKEQARHLLKCWADTGVLQIRDYPSKESFREDNETSPEARTSKVGEFAVCEDPEQQLEKLVQSSYFVSGGNPGQLLKVNNRVF